MWRPAVAQGPVASDTFDEHTAAAVRAFQRNMGLGTTGVVDENTRGIIQTSRCGVPDNIVTPDSSDKFALFSGTFFAPGSTVTYRLVTTTIPASLAVADVQAATQGAFRAWANETSLTFVSTTGSAKITVQFGNTGNPQAAAATNVQTKVITMSNTVGWAVFNAPSGRYDVQGILTHEIWHTLGLDHSAFLGATMFPNSTPQESFGARFLSIDDAVAISSRDDQYGYIDAPAPVNHGARDIGVGEDGSVWMISSEPWGSGYRVYKWDPNANPPQWDPSDGGAVRVSVDRLGRPWVTDQFGQIFRHTTNTTTSGEWDLLPGAAQDIAVGALGDVWVIGWCGGVADCAIFKWNEAEFNWDHDHANGAAVRIAVNAGGAPWVLNSALNFYRYTTRVGCGDACQTSDPNAGVWDRMPGLSQDLGIGPGPGTYVWSIGKLNSGLVSLEVWDEQTGFSGTSGAAPSESTWTSNTKPCSFDTNSAVAVGPRGQPYIVCDNGLVVTSIR
jgi:hypothetical protein